MSTTGGDGLCVHLNHLTHLYLPYHSLLPYLLLLVATFEFGMPLYDGMEGSVVEVCVTTNDTIKTSIVIRVTATPQSASGKVSFAASLHSVSNQPLSPFQLVTTL